MLAAAQAGVPISEYSPTEVKCAVVGYGRAEKEQVQHMVTLLLGLDEVPSPLDISDALAVAICHSHSLGPIKQRRPRTSGSWRRYRPGPGGGL